VQQHEKYSVVSTNPFAISGRKSSLQLIQEPSEDAPGDGYDEDSQMPTDVVSLQALAFQQKQDLDEKMEKIRSLEEALQVLCVLSPWYNFDRNPTRTHTHTHHHYLSRKRAKSYDCKWAPYTIPHR
jgi:hypothetical protein